MYSRSKKKLFPFDIAVDVYQSDDIDPSLPMMTCSNRGRSLQGRRSVIVSRRGKLALIFYDEWCEFVNSRGLILSTGDRPMRDKGPSWRKKVIVFIAPAGSTVLDWVQLPRKERTVDLMNARTREAHTRCTRHELGAIDGERGEEMLRKKGSGQ
jgi:hypothetical protein